MEPLYFSKLLNIVTTLIMRLHIIFSIRKISSNNNNRTRILMPRQSCQHLTLFDPFPGTGLGDLSNWHIGRHVSRSSSSNRKNDIINDSILVFSRRRAAYRLPSNPRPHYRRQLSNGTNRSVANDPRRLSINFPRRRTLIDEQPDDDRLQFRWWYGIIHLREGR